MLTKGVMWNLSCPVMGNWIYYTYSQFRYLTEVMFWFYQDFFLY